MRTALGAVFGEGGGSIYGDPQRAVRVSRPETSKSMKDSGRCIALRSISRQEVAAVIVQDNLMCCPHHRVSRQYRMAIISTLEEGRYQSCATHDAVDGRAPSRCIFDCPCAEYGFNFSVTWRHTARCDEPGSIAAEHATKSFWRSSSSDGSVFCHPIQVSQRS